MKTRLGLLLLSVCAAAAAPRAALAQAPESDASIVAAIEKSDVFRNDLKDDDVVVTSSGGAVVLSGTVFEEYHKTLAEETAAAVPGVGSVANRLVSGSPDPAANSDAWIAERVKAAFLLHRSAAAADADVEVKDGVVILNGDAVSERDKALATAYAREVEGVKSVDNRLEVAGTELSVKSSTLDKMDDASITARVHLALLFHRAAAGAKPKIKTKDGVVTLTGGVRSEADKDKIGKYVSGLDGVAGVDNRLTIEL